MTADPAESPDAPWLRLQPMAALGQDMLSGPAAAAPVGMRGLAVAALTHPAATAPNLRWLANVIRGYGLRLTLGGMRSEGAGAEAIAAMIIERLAPTDMDTRP